MHPSIIRSTGIALGLLLTGSLSGCDTMADNRLLDSIHQPMVEHRQYQLDLMTGPDGLTAENKGRLDGWFGALGLRYGDRIAIDDPLVSAQTRAAVKILAARYGLLINPTAPASQGFVNAGTVRIIVLRSTASVPHCPDLTTMSDTNFKNATSSNYGCSINGDLAAMVANPDDLLGGAHGRSMTTADTSDKAIWLHQAAIPTGQAAIAKNSTN
jgi:pilus assembly protein CpaD